MKLRIALADDVESHPHSEIRLHLQVGQKTEQSLSHINMVDIKDLTRFMPARSMRQEPVMSTTRLGGVITERMYARS
ncbi:MAG: hypothetical protein EBT73_05555 [Actinobacteria bacterium]|nr:hypothetical protein [Actinomycetota bacterium]